MIDTLAALNLWVVLTGVDPNAKSVKLSDWDVHTMTRTLKESLEYDESQITTLMLLGHFTDLYLKDRSMAVSYVLDHFDEVVFYLHKCKDMYSVVRGSEFCEIVNEYKKSLLDAVKYYGWDRNEVIKLINDAGELALIRRDAFKSINTLTVYQFYQGAETEAKPQYVPHVYEFWNMNSLICSMCCGPESFITLNLIRDSESDYETYFAFAIRNGKTVTILTDKPKHAHPMQRYMSRRPGREFSRREEKHHFPYALLDVQYDGKGDPYFNKTNQFGLVKYQHENRPMKEIKDLEADEILWVIMMFSLIEKRFWKEKYRTPEIAYTGDNLMIAGMGEVNINALQLRTDKQIVAAPLKNEDITTDSMMNEWEQRPAGIHRWIEDRFAHVVNDEKLNLLGGPGECKEKITVALGRDRWNDEKKAEYSLSHFNLTSFGSEKELIADQRWHARYNKAKMIQAANRKEFEETKEQILKWVETRVFENCALLLAAAARVEGKDDEKNIIGIGLIECEYQRHSWTAITIQKPQANDNKRYCYLTGKGAGLFVVFAPQTAGDLAFLCGIAEKDLPEVLRHWERNGRFFGNQILDRLDPMDWVVKNLWNELKFEVVIYLSKSAYNALRKQHGFDAQRFWENEPGKREVGRFRYMY